MALRIAQAPREPCTRVFRRILLVALGCAACSTPNDVSNANDRGATPDVAPDPALSYANPYDPTNTAARAYATNFDAADRIRPCTATARGLAELILEGYAWAEANQLPVDYDRLDRAAQALAAMQDVDPASPTYGNFRSVYADAGVKDENSVEFVALAVSAMALRFPEQLAADPAGPMLHQIMSLAYTGIENHLGGAAPLAVSYTNPYLMATYNQLALGRIFGDSAWIAAAQNRFDTWLAYTKESGIAEYMSSTYYGIDLLALGLMHNYAADADTRTRAAAALDLFWTDMLASFFARNERLGGSESRSYSFCRNLGLSGNYLYRAHVFDVANAPVYWHGLDDGSWYRPSDAILHQFDGDGPRVVLRRYDGTPSSFPYATHYLVPGRFSVGSSSVRYESATAQALTINLPTPNPAPGQRTADYAGLVNFGVDGRGDPYQVVGPSKTEGACTTIGEPSGINAFIASVQNRGDVLFLAASDGKTRTHGPVTHVVSNLVFPNVAGTEVWVDDALVPLAFTNASTYDVIDVAPASTIFIRLDGVATAVRLLLATDLDGHPLEEGALQLVADGPAYPGSARGNYRLAITHASAPPTSTNGVGVVALFSRTEQVGTGDFSAFRHGVIDQPLAFEPSYDSASGDVALAWPNMRVYANVKTETIAKLGGGDPAQADAILRVNGVEETTLLDP